jgi:hypothetical protein
MNKDSKLKRTDKEIQSIEGISPEKMLPGGKKIRNISIKIRNEDLNGGLSDHRKSKKSDSDSDSDREETKLKKANKEISNAKKHINEAE